MPIGSTEKIRDARFWGRNVAVPKIEAWYNRFSSIYHELDRNYYLEAVRTMITVVKFGGRVGSV